MLRQACRSHEGGHRTAAQPGKDLGCKDSWMGNLTGPGVNRLLVGSILGAADLGGTSAVRRVSLLGPESCENGLCCLAGAIAAPRDALSGAFLAVPATPVGDGSAAVGAAHGKRECCTRTHACVAVRPALVPCRALVRLGERREQRQPCSGAVGEGVRGLLDDST
jgi:hypothetical protein